MDELYYPCSEIKGTDQFCSYCEANLCLCFHIYQRTNGPVNAHLRSSVYTNVIENSPSIGADEALGPFFSQNNQYTVHTSFSLQMTF